MKDGLTVFVDLKQAYEEEMVEENKVQEKEYNRR